MPTLPGLERRSGRDRRRLTMIAVLSAAAILLLLLQHGVPVETLLDLIADVV